MNHRTYQTLLPFYAQPRRELAAWATENPEYAIAWIDHGRARIARFEEICRHHGVAVGKAFLDANPHVVPDPTQPLPMEFVELPYEALELEYLQQELDDF